MQQFKRNGIATSIGSIFKFSLYWFAPLRLLYLKHLFKQKSEVFNWRNKNSLSILFSPHGYMRCLTSFFQVNRPFDLCFQHWIIRKKIILTSVRLRREKINKSERCNIFQIVWIPSIISVLSSIYWIKVIIIRLPHWKMRYVVKRKPDWQFLFKEKCLNLVLFQRRKDSSLLSVSRFTKIFWINEEIRSSTIGDFTIGYYLKLLK